MLKTRKKSNTKSVTRLLLGLFCLNFTLSFASEVSASQTTRAPDWSSLVRISLTNPEDGIQSSCTGILVTPSRVATAASCLMSEERAKQGAQATVCLASKTGTCLNSKSIKTNQHYLGVAAVNNSYNLAYIDLQRSFDLKKHNITALKPIKPKDFQILAESSFKDKSIWLANYRDVASSSTRQRLKPVSGLEYNYIDKRFLLETAEVQLTTGYEGTVILLHSGNGFKFLGFVSNALPDQVIKYYPEVNPCDEDPILVRYPKSLSRSKIQITSYSVAACGMNGFQASKSFSELRCKRMLGALSAQRMLLQENNAIVLRQTAEKLLASDADESLTDIYKYLHQAQEKGDIKAKEILAELLFKGDVFPKDRETAQHLIVKDSKPISAYAHLLLARQLLFGYNDEDFRSLNSQLDAQLYEHLEVAAKAGYDDAQYYLGRLYQFGTGVKKNSKSAYNWYAMAAMQGNHKAQFQLGTMWVDGRGVRSYPHVGHYWIRQAAARGYERAQNYLAMYKGQNSIDTALNDYELEYNN